MEFVPVQRVVNNMEIICKLMNSVAKQYGCRFQYNPQNGGLQFKGDSTFQKHIVEEALSYFRAA
jgi:hypothetical protein